MSNAVTDQKEAYTSRMARIGILVDYLHNEIVFDQNDRYPRHIAEAIDFLYSEVEASHEEQAKLEEADRDAR